MRLLSSCTSRTISFTISVAAIWILVFAIISKSFYTARSFSFENTSTETPNRSDLNGDGEILSQALLQQRDNHTLSRRGDGARPPIDPWEKAVAKGGDLICAWYNDAYGSGITRGKSALRAFGWSQDTANNELGSNVIDALRDAFEALDIPLHPPDTFMSTWVNDQLITYKDEEYEPTDARYQQAFNVKKGVLVVTATYWCPDKMKVYADSISVVQAEYNVGPQYQINEFNEKNSGTEWPTKATPLARWSDVTFVIMRFAALMFENKPVNFNWVFRCRITNEETRGIIKKALDGSLQNIRAWPGQTFKVTREDVNGKALLGSPNGSGVGFMIADHKTKLGSKIVGEIIVFAGQSGEGQEEHEIYPYMAMKIVEKDADDDQQGRSDSHQGA